MRLLTVIIRNFRCYKDEFRISLDDFTALVGKNDVGKSSILDALSIFFNESSVKLDPGDISVDSQSQEITIGCEFTDYPAELILDKSAKTNLDDEYLLNANKNLEIHKIYDLSGVKVKETVCAYANYPSAKNVSDLYLLKNLQLKERITSLSIDKSGVNLSNNPSIRKGIYAGIPDLLLKMQHIPLNVEDAKAIWNKLEENLPLFALFRADRPSRDDDAEVQDPMKFAILEAVKNAEAELDAVRKKVEEKAIEVADRTLIKLKEIDPNLASELKPNFKTEPKWEGFKLSLTSDKGIPINKRGSGVRRLILLSFFQAEADRKQHEKNSNSVIYAVEEPESSQHPNNQKIIAESLLKLSSTANQQVIITTHVPGFANLIPIEKIRYIERLPDDSNKISSGKEPGIARVLADTLGSLPDYRVKILVCVEGPNDVSCLKHLSRILHQKDQKIIDISSDKRVAVIPIGGSNLGQWVYNDYLQDMNLPQFHIYDRGTDNPPKYQKYCDEINGKHTKDMCVLTKKPEMENYIHHDAICTVMGITLPPISLNEDVPLLVAKAVHEADVDPSKTPWSELIQPINKPKLDKKMTRAKTQLNDAVVSAMTFDQLLEVDVDNEVTSWLKEISDRL